MKKVSILAYLLCSMVSGLCLFSGVVYSNDTDDDDEEASEQQAQHEDGGGIWQVRNGDLNNHQVAGIYSNIRNQLSLHPGARRFMTSFDEVYSRSETAPWQVRCRQLVVDPRRLHVFAAVLGIDFVGLQSGRHVPIGRTRINWGLPDDNDRAFRVIWTFKRGPQTLEQVIFESMSAEVRNFGWYQIGMALLMVGELHRNLHVEPALADFNERYGHLAGEFEISHHVRLQLLQINIQRFNQAATEIDQARDGWFQNPFVIGGVATVFYLVACQVLFVCNDSGVW